jgi:hypothetical protein
LREDLQKFLKPSPGIQCDHPKVRALAAKVTKKAVKEAEAARLLFEFVRDTVRYSVYVPFTRLEDYLALNTLKRGAGFCAQKAALLGALARSAGIPARLGFADIRNDLLPAHLAEIMPDRVIYHHTFLEWRINGRWLKATPSFDAQLTLREGWHLVEFSPEADALLPATDLSGRPHVTYLRYHGWRTGMPVKEFLKVTAQAYAIKDIKTWQTLAAKDGLAAAGKETP